MVSKLLFILLFTLGLQGESLPLQGKKLGVEFNFPRILTYSDSWKSASGSFSYFNQQDNVEIALPWHMAFYTDKFDETGEEHYDVYNVDIHYRKFLGPKMDGFYLSGFVRYSYLNGLLEHEDSYKKTSKLGLGVGIGYRIFPKTQPFYWGVGLIVGRYMTGENELYREVGLSIEDAPYIVDIELLKFGYAF